VKVTVLLVGIVLTSGAFWANGSAGPRVHEVKPAEADNTNLDGAIEHRGLVGQAALGKHAKDGVTHLKAAL
jgi:hypothetical protein